MLVDFPASTGGSPAKRRRRGFPCSITCRHNCGPGPAGIEQECVKFVDHILCGLSVRAGLVAKRRDWNSSTSGTRSSTRQPTPLDEVVLPPLARYREPASWGYLRLAEPRSEGEFPAADSDHGTGRRPASARAVSGRLLRNRIASGADRCSRRGGSLPVELCVGSTRGAWRSRRSA